jgi:hypothetical protein
MGPDGSELAIFSPARGGFSTPHTPESVKYYLDQAHRAESVGATSAAVAMYRSAAEMLLHHEGYTSGMLAKKIADLQADAAPPRWRGQIDADYLEILKTLGNAAIHPNDGDITRQQHLDRELLHNVRLVWEELLQTIYEQPAAAAARRRSSCRPPRRSLPPETPPPGVAVLAAAPGTGRADRAVRVACRAERERT